MSATAAAADLVANQRPDEPWLGLESYGESDAWLFCGREDETEELLRLVRREVLTVLFGPSGTGKTSLLRAGLFPKLRHEYFLPIPIRLDYSKEAPRPVDQVRAALAQSVSEQRLEQNFTAPASSADETLWEYLHRLLLWTPRNDPVLPVLVFDQFEETFTLGGSHGGTSAFITELSNLVENYIPQVVRERVARSGVPVDFDPSTQHYKVLIALREDFVSRLDELRKLIPSVMHNRFSLKRMDGRQALRPVLGPGHRVVTEAVAEQIVRKVASADPGAPLEGLEVDPALLSLMCRELNARRLRENQPTIPSELVNSAASDVLKDFYDRSFRGLKRHARIFVEDRLLTSEGFRTTVALDAAAHENVKDDMEVLVNRRLLRGEERLGLPHLELTHDVLTKVAVASRNERQERQRRDEDDRRRALEENARKAELRRTRRLLVAAAAVAIVCLALAAVALTFYQYAQQSLEVAEEATDTARVANTNLLHVQRLSRLIRLTNDVAKSQLGLLLGVHVAAETLEGDPGKPLAAIDVIRQQLRVMGGRPVMGHLDRTSVASFAGDGRWMATGSEDGGVRLWKLTAVDLARGSLDGAIALAPHRGRVHDVAFSRSGEWLASGGADGTTRMWRIANEGARAVLEFSRPEFGSIRAVTFSPSAEWFVFGTESGHVCIWKMSPDGPAQSACDIGKQDKPVTKVAFSQNGRWLATAELTHGNDAAFGAPIALWNAASPVFPREEPKRLLPAAPLVEPSLQVFAFSNDERRLGVAYGYEAQVWDLDERHPPESIVRRMTHGQWIRTLAFSPDNKWLATGSIDTNVHLWDLAAPPAPPLALEGHAGSVRSVAFSDDGKWFVSAGDDGVARLWDLSGPLPASRLLRGQEKAIERVIFSPGPSPAFVLGLGEDIRARVWNVPDSSVEPLVLRGHGGAISSAAVSPDGQWIASAGFTDNRLLVWSASAPGAPRHQLQLPSSATMIAFSANGRWLAALTNTTVHVWSVADLPNKIWQLDNGGPAGSATLGFSMDSRWLLSGTWTQPGFVNLWDVSRESPPARPSFRCTQDQEVRAIAFSANGRYAVTGAHGWQASLWDLSATDPCSSRRSFGPHGDAVAGVAVSVDGNWIATASFDGKGRLWSRTAPGAPVATAEFQNRVTEATFGPDGRAVAFASWDRTIKLLDPQNPTQAAVGLPGHDGRILATAFARDGRTFASAGEDRTIRLWDRTDPSAAPVVLRHDSTVIYLGFPNDGRWLVSASHDGTIRMWRLKYDELVNVACETAGRRLTPEELTKYLPGEHADLPCVAAETGKH